MCCSQHVVIRNQQRIHIMLRFFYIASAVAILFGGWEIVYNSPNSITSICCWFVVQRVAALVVLITRPTALCVVQKIDSSTAQAIFMDILTLLVTNNNNNKKVSYCCDSQSYCIRQYDRLKQLLRDINFNAIHCAASRPVNKNFNTGTVIKAKRGTDRAGRS